MVFFFTSSTVDPPAVMYMGRDKYENEDMLKWGVEEDVWFHVDDLSSAHVYLKLQPGWTVDSIPESVLTDCCQLVKANSIEGNKKNHVKIVYTAWRNLKKLPSHDVGQVAFHSAKQLKYATVEKRVNETVNRLNKTKDERQVDWQEEKRKWEDQRRRRQRIESEQAKRDEEGRLAEERKRRDLLLYKGVIDEAKMSSNRGTSPRDLEEDFFG